MCILSSLALFTPHMHVYVCVQLYFSLCEGEQDLNTGFDNYSASVPKGSFSLPTEAFHSFTLTLCREGDTAAAHRSKHMCALAHTRAKRERLQEESEDI